MMESELKRLSLLSHRRSVRTFSDREIEKELLRKLTAEMTFINSHEAGMYFQIFSDDPSPFEGFKRSYGFFRNARNFFACVVDTSFDNSYERAGYFAEQLVVKAVSLGLGTCFVGGTYDRKAVPSIIRAGQKLLFLIVFGYKEEQKTRWMDKTVSAFLHRKDKSWREYFTGDISLDEALKMKPDLEIALKALSLSPSAMNQRPVRLKLQNGSIVAFTYKDNPDTLIDLGIAKFNIAFATGAEFVWGNPGILYENDHTGLSNDID